MQELRTQSWIWVTALATSLAHPHLSPADEIQLKRPTLKKSDPNGLIEWTRQVYSNGKWNATPDIAYWRGNYYVSVNQGKVHNGMDGPSIVLRSANLKRWQLVYTTMGAPGAGSAVDCKLLSLPDRLILYYVYMNRGRRQNYSETRAVYTTDGQTWSKSQRAYKPGHNFWKPKVHDNVVYVASDHINAGRGGHTTTADEKNVKLYQIELLRSRDGLSWEHVSTIQKNAPWSITETSLTFRPNGELWALTRQDFLSRSRPPYTKWTNERAYITGGGIAGPALLTLGRDLYLAGRFYSYLAKHGPPESPQTNKFATSLLKYNEKTRRFKPIADLPLPSYADMGYSSFVATKDGVFLVYYSGHAYRKANLARGKYTTQTDVYISKLKLPGPSRGRDRTTSQRVKRKPTRDQLKRQRKMLAQRRRRIVFNNDGDDISRLGTGAAREGLVGEKLKRSVVHYPLSADGFLQVRTKALIGTHVDSVWYYSTWGMKLHHSNGPFAQLYGCPNGGRSTKNYQALRQATGKDNLELMIEFCRKHRIEVFYSNRMNDIHDAFNTSTLYNLRRKHPEWCLSTQKIGKKYSYPDVRSCWSAWNFAIPQVRAMTVAALREVCRTYDIDGIELDFFRHFIYFPETLEFKPVTPAHLTMMNDMMRKIRAIADEEGLRRGRPILLVGRCMEDVELSKNSGMDVATWLKEDLVDMLSMVASTEHTPPINKLTALARRFKTPVYPMMGPVHTSVPDNLNKLPARMGNLPVWRGHAINLFAQGAAGIQFFNIFDPTLPQWSELGELRVLLRKDRTYVWDFRPSQRKNRPTYAQMRLSRYKQPVTVHTSGCEPMLLYVGEDLRVADSAGRQRKLTLRVRALGLNSEHGLQIQVGGHKLPKPKYTPAPSKTGRNIWLRYAVTPAMLRQGENKVTATIQSEAGGAPRIDQIRLDVRY